ncbi:MAG TPA: TetR/AcrR family transcriptional regulator [Sandaracinaceae bacterium]
MPRSPKDNLQIRAARRDAILAAATRVFAKKGFARAKISDIAKEAGLSHGLVYHYFDSKAAVFGAIADAMMARYDRDLEDAHGRAIDRIVASLERNYARLKQPIDEQRVIMQAMLQGSVPEEVKARLAAHFGSLFRRVCAWVREAQRDGDLVSDVPAEELAATLFCLVRGMSIRFPGIPQLPFAPPRTQTIVRLVAGRPPAKGTRTRTARAKSAARRKVRRHATAKKK